MQSLEIIEFELRHFYRTVSNKDTISPFITYTLLLIRTTSNDIRY
ncbi:hypothetical protein HMPREF0666_01187 [Prevotella sp. C561]|nr:hypothetical protein HMPREF0666_01187 [Prevotella sp. C561]